MNKKKRIVEEILARKPYLVWDIKQAEFLSEESAVEAVLTRADFDDFLKLIEILGLQRVGEIFYSQTSKMRSNYSNRTSNFFRLFFERNLKNAQGSADGRAN